jgi:hypothetical protein
MGRSLLLAVIGVMLLVAVALTFVFANPQASVLVAAAAGLVALVWLTVERLWFSRDKTQVAPHLSDR